MYTPDRWMLLKLNSPKGEAYKVFGTWLGGYQWGDSWRLNSGVKKVELEGEWIFFHGYSGSIYKCHSDNVGASSYTYHVLSDMVKVWEEGGNSIEVIRFDDAKKYLEIGEK